MKTFITSHQLLIMWRNYMSDGLFHMCKQLITDHLLLNHVEFADRRSIWFQFVPEMVFFLSIYWPNCRSDNPGHPECTVVYVGFSRDGYHFTRTDAPRVPFAPWGKVPGAWNYGKIFLLNAHAHLHQA